MLAGPTLTIGGESILNKVFGDKIETTYIENVPDGMESYRVIESLAKRGYKVIFTTSFGFMDATLEAAKKYPNTIFLHCSGYKTYKNMSAYFGSMYEPSFLAGIVAGMMTKSNVIGYVAPHPILEVIRITNAFALGVKLVNPNAKIHVVWTNAWYDPATEKEAALSLLDAGADIIAQHQDSPAPVWNWGVYYAKVTKEIMKGTYKHGFYWGVWMKESWI